MKIKDHVMDKVKYYSGTLPEPLQTDWWNYGHPYKNRHFQNFPRAYYTSTNSNDDMKSIALVDTKAMIMEFPCNKYYNDPYDGLDADECKWDDPQIDQATLEEAHKGLRLPNPL